MTNAVISRMRLAKLASAPLLSDLSVSELDSLATVMRFRVVSKGALIASHAHPVDRMYLLISGSVRVAMPGHDGAEGLLLDRIEAPGHFGDLSMDRRPGLTPDIIAITDVEFFELDAEDLSRAIQIHPKLALSIISAMSRRLRHAVTRLDDIASHDAMHRVMRVLLNVATAALETKGTPLVSGITQAEIGALAGTSRETASRIIAQLNREGAVTVQGRKILVDIAQVSQRLQLNS